MKIVISQPMYFPWIGIFEQIKLSDVYVHYDDVQFSKGSFTNRVQIKTNSTSGFSWLTVPLKEMKLGYYINEVKIDLTKNWQHQHLELLKLHYNQAPYTRQVIDIVNNVFDMNAVSIGELSSNSIIAIADYFDLSQETDIYKSSQLNIKGSSSERVYEVVRHFNGDSYITGHGARNYLNHDLFETNGIKVKYMNYQKKPYIQLHGEFNPYVSILDVIANLGKQGKDYILSSTIDWQDFLKIPINSNV
jgi:hypothetical protein